jgi:hypothetical protein
MTGKSELNSETGFVISAEFWFYYYTCTVLLLLCIVCRKVAPAKIPVRKFFDVSDHEKHTGTA